MKTKIYLFLVLIAGSIIVPNSLVAQRSGEYDDVYFSTKDRERQGAWDSYKSSSKEDYTPREESNRANSNYDQPENNQSLAQNTENYSPDRTDLDGEDYYNSNYASRIRRFHRRPISSYYYDPFYGDPYNEYRYNMNTRFSYDPFYDSWYGGGFGFSFHYGYPYNPWRPSFYDRHMAWHYRGSYGSWCNNWGWNSWAYRNGYWNGYRDRWWDRNYIVIRPDLRRPSHYGKRYNLGNRGSGSAGSTTPNTRANRYAPVKSDKTIKSYDSGVRKDSYKRTRPSTTGTQNNSSTNTKRTNTTRANDHNNNRKDRYSGTNKSSTKSGTNTNVEDTRTRKRIYNSGGTNPAGDVEQKTNTRRKRIYTRPSDNNNRRRSRDINHDYKRNDNSNYNNNNRRNNIYQRRDNGSSGTRSRDYSTPPQRSTRSSGGSTRSRTYSRPK